MDEITARFRIVTPMFLGGARPAELADAIRPPSIKGALRFWWRALAWSSHRAKARDDAEALRNLHRDEAAIFGIAASNTRRDLGQSKVLLSTTWVNEPAKESQWPANNTGSGYLGLGLFQTKDTPHRTAWTEGGEFDLRLLFAPDISPEQRSSVTDAVHLFGLLGGLGGRGQRRGFGSIALTSLNGESQIHDSEAAYDGALNRWLKVTRDTPPPPYTALCASTKWKRLSKGLQARAVHGEMGMAYKNHRGQPSSLRGPIKVPFGLPLAGVDDNARRASPLLFHVHPVGQEFVGTVVYLPTSQFHPRYQTPDMTPVEAFVS